MIGTHPCFGSGDFAHVIRSFYLCRLFSEVTDSDTCCMDATSDLCRLLPPP
jgi:hypothetical protein